ncbi:hypothetical protein [Massilia niastensis]|uniref:hypothetical protein n=1 Tax=Massilia niastensis TaxID=544911 RepID=UPI0012EBBA96|nr:hypothetical protein [Massilia niastensis]
MGTLAMQAGGRIRTSNLHRRNVFLYLVRRCIVVGEHDNLVSAYQLVEPGKKGVPVALRTGSGALLCSA